MIDGNRAFSESRTETAPEWALAHAVQALAFEQRTANLIAYASVTERWTEGHENTIRERLGLPPVEL